MKNTINKKWIYSCTGENKILQGDSFYVSYHPDPIGGDRGFDGETAVVLENENNNGTIQNKFYILKGDFRKEMEEAFPDLQACMLVFYKYPEKKSSWSD